MKHWKYLKYVLRHKWFVFVECCNARMPFVGIIHDLSKFRPSEWFPYAENFYGKGGEKRTAIDPKRGYSPAEQETLLSFDVAWLRHIHRNPHHWQFWVLIQDEDADKPLEMPHRYRMEMLCDWRGAGRAQGFGDNTETWYEAHKDKMILEAETRKWIEEQI